MKKNKKIKNLRAIKAFYKGDYSDSYLLNGKFYKIGEKYGGEFKTRLSSAVLEDLPFSSDLVFLEIETPEAEIVNDGEIAFKQMKLIREIRSKEILHLDTSGTWAAKMHLIANNAKDKKLYMQHVIETENLDNLYFMARNSTKAYVNKIVEAMLAIETIKKRSKLLGDVYYYTERKLTEANREKVLKYIFEFGDPNTIYDTASYFPTEVPDSTYDRLLSLEDGSEYIARLALIHGIPKVYANKLAEHAFSVMIKNKDYKNLEYVAEKYACHHKLKITQEILLKYEDTEALEIAAKYETDIKRVKKMANTLNDAGKTELADHIMHAYYEHVAHDKLEYVY